MKHIKNETLYLSLINGARLVMQNKSFLNKINVFPVADGDTGTNLFSTMQSVVMNSEVKPNLKDTLESVADSAIIGARGNSGLIFAQYFQGLSEGAKETDEMSLQDFIQANREGMTKAYNAIETPVEGTILTIMRTFHNALLNKEYSDELELLDSATKKVEKAVEETPSQLKVLKKANVVDSGAKGFYYFIKGFVDGLKGHFTRKDDLFSTEVLPELVDVHEEAITYRYCTEALITTDKDESLIKDMVRDLGDSLVTVKGKKKMRLHIHTDHPEVFFDRLSSHGKIMTQKVDDMVKQYDMVHHRKYDRVIVTDSIADLPKDYVDQEQIHVVNLNILFDDETYIDKLTITNEMILSRSSKSKDHPSSSQPSVKSIENTFNYLLNYYKEIIVITVSEALSGTHNAFVKVAMDKGLLGNKIHIINSKQNSVAQGLLVWQAQEYLKLGINTNELIGKLNADIIHSKILVQINTLDPMIASGRLSVKAGGIAKKVGLKPIVTLNENGEGAIGKIAFSKKSAIKKIINMLDKLHNEKKIKRFAVTYIDDYESAMVFSKQIEEKLGIPCEFIVQSSSIIAVGAGTGAQAVSYIVD
jgi:DegV family protein with EDD domain